MLISRNFHDFGNIICAVYDVVVSICVGHWPAVGVTAGQKFSIYWIYIIFLIIIIYCYIYVIILYKYFRFL